MSSAPVEIAQMGEFIQHAMLDSLDEALGEARVDHLEEPLIGIDEVVFDVVTTGGQVFTVNVTEKL